MESQFLQKLGKKIAGSSTGSAGASLLTAKVGGLNALESSDPLRIILSLTLLAFSYWKTNFYKNLGRNN